MNDNILFNYKCAAVLLSALNANALSEFRWLFIWKKDSKSNSNQVRRRIEYNMDGNEVVSNRPIVFTMAHAM